MVFTLAFSMVISGITKMYIYECKNHPKNSNYPNKVISNLRKIYSIFKKVLRLRILRFNPLNASFALI